MNYKNVKTALTYILIAAVILSIISCASAKPSKNDSLAAEEIFEDWEHRGLGKALPLWVEPAAAGNYAEVRRNLPACKSKKLLILSAEGTDIRQARNKLNLYPTDSKEIKVFQEGGTQNAVYELVEHIWVRRKNSGTVTAYRIYAASRKKISRK